MHMKIRHDMHMHTHLSVCCVEKDIHIPENIISLAEEMKLHTLGFSDHMWTNSAITPSAFYAEQDFRQIELLKDILADIDTPVRISVGCEADMPAPGIFTVTPESVESLDHVLLACSHFHMKDFIEQPETNNPKDVAKHLLRHFRAGAEADFITAIAHPFFPLGHIHNYDKIIAAISDAELIDACGIAAENNIAMEITTAYLPGSKGFEFSYETPLRILECAKKASCSFVCGSDAHDPDRQKELLQLEQFINDLQLTERDFIAPM